MLDRPTASSSSSSVNQTELGLEVGLSEEFRCSVYGHGDIHHGIVNCWTTPRNVITMRLYWYEWRTSVYCLYAWRYTKYLINAGSIQDQSEAVIHVRYIALISGIMPGQGRAIPCWRIICSALIEQKRKVSTLGVIPIHGSWVYSQCWKISPGYSELESTDEVVKRKTRVKR